MSGSLEAGTGMTNKGDLLKEHLSGRSYLKKKKQGKKEGAKINSQGINKV